MTQQYIYSFYEKTHNGDIGSCIVDGFDKKTVVDSLIQYLNEKVEEEQSDMDFDVIFCLYHDETGREKFKELTISINYEEDTYDNGRFDYLCAIGAI